MHRQTFPGEHQKNHQRGFKQPATANTNTHTHRHTHLLAAEVKARSDERRGTKSVSLHSKVLQHLRLTLRVQGLAFFSTSVSSTHPHIYAALQGFQAHQVTEKAAKVAQGASGTISACQGQAVWPRTSPYNTQSAVGKEDQYTACVCMLNNVIDDMRWRMIGQMSSA